MTDLLRATAFHARAAAANRSNAWVARNGVTLAAAYTHADDEVLAARTRVGLADLGARWQLILEGPRVVEFLQRLLTRDVSKLPLSNACKALWLSDGGGVRGAAAIARLGKDAFWLLSASPDRAWIAAAAALFDVTVRDVSQERNGVAVIGPYAQATLEATGIRANLKPLAFRNAAWRGFDVIVSRFGEHGGYEVWCAGDDAAAAWDRIARAGAAFGLEPVGASAMDVLDVEAGIPRPFRDYMPASDGLAREPSHASLGLESLVDVQHPVFNGARALTKRTGQEQERLVGVEIEAETSAPHTPLFAGGRNIGRTLSSCYSPALRRAIALAQVSADAAKPGTRFTLTLPSSFERPELRSVGATAIDLPFLEQPAPVPE